MDNIPVGSRTSQILLTAAAFVVVIAGLKAAAVIVVPFLLSIFIAVICSTPLFWLKSKGLSTWVSLLIVIAGILMAGFVVATLLGSSIDDFSQNIPAYRSSLNHQYESLLDLLERFRIDTSKFELVEIFDPDRMMQLVSRLINGLGDILANGLLIILTVVFMLLEASSLPAKLKSVFRNPDESFGRITDIINNINHYLAIKTVISLITGFLVAATMYIMRVDYPLIWGLLAFLLNYVPNIGSIIAALPAVFQALVQFGLGRAAAVAAAYLVINLVMGNVVEPRFMGRGLGLSTLVVFLSLIFWGWVLGPVGMLLSVVLTVTVRITLESRDDTRWIAVLLGSHAEPDDHQKKA